MEYCYVPVMIINGDPQNYGVFTTPELALERLQVAVNKLTESVKENASIFLLIEQWKLNSFDQPDALVVAMTSTIVLKFKKEM